LHSAINLRGPQIRYRRFDRNIDNHPAEKFDQGSWFGVHFSINKMHSNDALPTNETDLSWPQTLSAILIMGKRQGTKKDNKQLWGRVALAAALWYSAPDPKPYLLFLTSDVHGPLLAPDAQVVKRMLSEKYRISADYVIVRPVSNCTLLEVRAARVLSKIYKLDHIFAVTHLYHAPRTQRYLNEVLPHASVIPVHPEILVEIVLPSEYSELFGDLPALIRASMPGWFDSSREYLIEWLLSRAHTLDPRGRFERRLAKLLRPTAYRYG
jgi:hypothetical protein